jgi:hypothetical protein
MPEQYDQIKFPDLRNESIGDAGPFMWEVDVGEVDAIGWFELQGLDEALSYCLSYELLHGIFPDTEQLFG